jgi:hypothetical protein
LAAAAAAAAAFSAITADSPLPEQVREGTSKIRLSAGRS